MNDFMKRFDKAANKHLSWKSKKINLGRQLCSVCKKKPVKWVIGKGNSYEYGFCSKVCIANNAIEHYKMEKVN